MIGTFHQELKGPREKTEVYNTTDRWYLNRNLKKIRATER